MAKEPYAQALEALEQSPPDAEKFQAALLKGVAKGDADCMGLLGEQHVYGELVPQNLKEGIRLLRLAAEDLDLFALCVLARCYQEARGVHRNERLAFELFHKAALNGDPDAIGDVADCYNQGKGTAKNKRLAALWYDLYDCLKEGDGISFETDGEDKPYDQNDKEPFHQAQSLAFSEPKNEAKALKIHLREAKKGDIDSAFILGLWYCRGVIVEENMREAIRYMRQAAKGPLAASFFYMGKAYEYSMGVGENLRLAYEYYTKAAIYDYVDALPEVAHCLSYGIGVEKNPRLAKIWRDRAKSLKQDA